MAPVAEGLRTWKICKISRIQKVEVFRFSMKIAEAGFHAVLARIRLISMQKSAT